MAVHELWRTRVSAMSGADALRQQRYIRTVWGNHHVQIDIELDGYLDDDLAAKFADALEREIWETIGRFRVGMSDITVVKP